MRVNEEAWLIRNRLDSKPTRGAPQLKSPVARCLPLAADTNQRDKNSENVCPPASLNLNEASHSGRCGRRSNRRSLWRAVISGENAFGANPMEGAFSARVSVNNTGGGAQLLQVKARGGNAFANSRPAYSARKAPLTLKEFEGGARGPLAAAVPRHQRAGP